MKTRSRRNAQVIPGINVRWPWSRKIIDGSKTVETRNYPIPKKYLGVPMALIETSGVEGKKNGISRAQILGIVRFTYCHQYDAKSDWQADKSRHLVEIDDPDFQWNPKIKKWAWQVECLEAFERPLPAPKKKGILFTSSVKV